MPYLSALPPVKILIVEDNRSDVLLVREALKEANVNFDLMHAKDGEEAVRLIKDANATGDSPHLDLLLLDLNLPKHDGWEVFGKIRSIPDLSDLPVVFLSSSGNPEDEERAVGLGKSMYIRKPATLDEFLAIGRQLVEFLASRRPG